MRPAMKTSACLTTLALAALALAALPLAREACGLIRSYCDTPGAP